jgi:hypothetical protein
LRVIRARLVGDAKIGAEESGSEFRDKQAPSLRFTINGK